MADTINSFAYEIQRMPDGGYIVIDGGGYRDDPGRLPRWAKFASTNIDEALGYIRDRLKPVEK